MRAITLCLLIVVVVSPAAQPADAAPIRLETVHGPVLAEVVLEGLAAPSAIEFLPDGRAIVADRVPSRLLLADFAARRAQTIEDLPPLLSLGDGGLHDIELHPDYIQNGWIYLSYTEGQEYRSTLALDRVRLKGRRLVERERLLTADAWAETTTHYGGRIQFIGSYLYLTVGDRYQRERAQDRSDHVGKILRLHDDGRVPDDNPFAATASEQPPPLPEIWSYGHRNPQGLFADRGTGELWSNEHGPRGGDEINLIQRGANYGWPEISFGFEYDGGPIGKGIVSAEGLEQPVWVFVPSIAPSDLVVYHGGNFPAWEGSLLSGALGLQHLNRVVVRDGTVVLEERIGIGQLGRVRSIAIDATGLVYLGSDSGFVWRLSPLASP